MEYSGHRDGYLCRRLVYVPGVTQMKPNYVSASERASEGLRPVQGHRQKRTQYTREGARTEVAMASNYKYKRATGSMTTM